jgi:VWFA-related protein
VMRTFCGTVYSSAGGEHLRLRRVAGVVAVNLVGIVTLMSLPVLGQGTTDGPRSVGGLTFIDEVELTVVNVMVHVTDSSGRTVTDLAQDEFRVFQDGEPKPISNFHLYTQEMYSAYRATEPLSPLAQAPTDEVRDDDGVLEPRPIYVVLYIDNQNIHPMERNRALSQMRDFVRDNLRPPLQMMVVSYQKSFEVMQPFTSEPREIFDAIRAVRTYTGGRTALESEQSEILDLMQRQQEEAGSTGHAARSTREYQAILSRVLAFADAENNDLVFSLQGLRDTVNLLAGLPGRKSIFYVSNGLPMVAGMGLFSAVSATYQDLAILNNIGRYDRTSLYDSLVETANTHDVTIYTFGVGGLELDTLATADTRSAKDPLAASRGADTYLDSMRFMARGTGGVAVLNTNDISLGLERIEEYLFTYYSLGYTLNTSGADKIHRIDVEIPNHPKYDLNYRRRVVEKSHETKAQEKVLTGLMFDLDENPMGLDVAVEPSGPAAEGRLLVPVLISFDLRTVALLPEGEDYVGRVTLFIAARDKGGKHSDLVRQKHEVRVPVGEYVAAQEGRFSIAARLLMEEGSYRIAVGVMDQLTRQASFRTFATSVKGP